MIRGLVLLLTTCIACFGNDESVKVLGKPNPFSVEEADLSTAELSDSGPAVTTTVRIRGKLWNKGEEILLRIVVRVKAKLANGTIKTATFQIGHLDRHQLERFEVAIPGVKKESEIVSASYEAVSFLTNDEAWKLKGVEARQRAALCSHTRRSLGNKAIGSLTVNETDLINACKLAGLW